MAALRERRRHGCTRCPCAAEVCRLPFYSTLLTVAVHTEIIGCKLQELKGRYSSYLDMLLGGWQHCLRRAGVENNNPIIHSSQIPLGSAAGLEMRCHIREWGCLMTWLQLESCQNKGLKWLQSVHCRSKTSVHH